MQGIYGGGYSSLVGYGGKVRIHRILSLHVNRKAGGLWGERKRWSGWDFAAVVWHSVPSPAHVHDEVMRDPRPLTN